MRIQGKGKECIICNEDFYPHPLYDDLEVVCETCIYEHEDVILTYELPFPPDCCFTEEELGPLAKVYTR